MYEYSNDYDGDDTCPKFPKLGVITSEPWDEYDDMYEWDDE